MLPLNTFINSIFPLLVYTVEFCKNYCVVYAQEKKSALSRKSCNIQSAYLSCWPILFLTTLFMHLWHIWHIEAVSVKFFLSLCRSDVWCFSLFSHYLFFYFISLTPSLPFCFSLLSLDLFHIFLLCCFCQFALVFVGMFNLI